MSKQLYIGFTKRKGDIIALIVLGVFLLAQLAQVVYSIGYCCYEPEPGFKWEPGLIIKAIVLYVPPFLVAYGGLIFYLIRDKEILPRWPMFYSKGKTGAIVFGVIYFITLILFLLLSLMIGPDYYDNEADFNILAGGFITFMLGIPADLLGLFLWYRNFGRERTPKKENPEYNQEER